VEGIREAALSIACEVDDPELVTLVERILSEVA
jgi:hypothetical protein